MRFKKLIWPEQTCYNNKIRREKLACCNKESWKKIAKKVNWQDKLATTNSANKLTCQKKKISKTNLLQQQNSATQTDALKQNHLARQTTATKFGETNSRVATNKFSLRKQTCYSN